MNFSALSRESLFGRIARLPLRLVPPSAVMPILQGPARGLRWVAGASTHGCWLGSYEADAQHALSRIIPIGGTFYDIGANVGFFTLVGAACVGPAGRVFAFEPLPRNLARLRRHVEINRLDGVQVIAAAVGDAVGIARFAEHDNGDMSHLSPTGDLQVAVTTVDAFVASGYPPPDAIKIDVEGAELALLKGARATLESFAPAIFLAPHSRTLWTECRALLRDLGYRIEGFPSGRSPEDSWDIVAVPPVRH